MLESTFLRKRSVQELPCSYMNRRGQIYYFKRVNKNGEYYYYVTRRKTGELLQTLPEDLEIYEYPKDGKVTLRKRITKHLLEEEVNFIKAAVNQYSTIKDFLVEVNDNHLTVYLGEMDEALFANLMLTVFQQATDVSSRVFKLLQRYAAAIRFVLEETDQRHFVVQLPYTTEHGSVTWLNIERSNCLKHLSKKYCSQLGKKPCCAATEPPEYDLK